MEPSLIAQAPTSTVEWFFILGFMGAGLCVILWGFFWWWPREKRRARKSSRWTTWADDPSANRDDTSG